MIISNGGNCGKPVRDGEMEPRILEKLLDHHNLDDDTEPWRSSSSSKLQSSPTTCSSSRFVTESSRTSSSSCTSLTRWKAFAARSLPPSQKRQRPSAPASPQSLSHRTPRHSCSDLSLAVGGRLADCCTAVVEAMVGGRWQRWRLGIWAAAGFAYDEGNKRDRTSSQVSFFITNMPLFMLFVSHRCNQ